MNYEKMWYELKSALMTSEEERKKAEKYFLYENDVLNMMARIEIGANIEKEIRKQEIDMTFAKMMEREG